MSTPTALRATASHANLAIGATCDVVIPAGARVGDMLIIHAGATNGSQMVWSAAVVGGASLGAPTYQAYRASLDSVIWVHTVATGEPGATLRVTDGVAAHYVAATILVLASPGVVDVQAFTLGVTSSVNPVAPSINTASADDTVIALYIETDNAARTYSAAPAGFTIAVQVNCGVVVSGGLTLMTAYELDQVAAGATGTLTATTTGPGNSWIAHTLALLTPTANIPPVANAGPDQSGIASGATVTLDGSASSDADGTVAVYQWRQISGTAVTLSSVSAQKPTFTAPSNVLNSNAVFGLIVVDNGGASSTEDTIQVNFIGTGGGLLGYRDSAQNSGAAGIEASITFSPLIVGGDVALMFLDVANLDAVIDPVGFTRIYQQNIGTGQTVGWKRLCVDTDASSVILVDWPTTSAKWVVQAEFMKNADFTLSDVKVALEPSVDATHSAPTVTVAATGSWVVEHAVDRGSPPSTSLTPPVLMTSRKTLAGTGTAALTSALADSGGVIAVGSYSGDVWTGTVLTNNAAVIAVAVQPLGGSNLQPIAVTGPAQAGIEPWTTVTLDGSGSYDPDGPSVTYGWTQLAGPSVSLSSGTVALPTFMAPGVLGGATLVFGLVVVDQFGLASVQASTQVTVLTATSFMAHGGAWVAYRSLLAQGGVWN